MSLSDESDWEWDSGEEDEYVYDDWPDHKKPKVYRTQNRFDISVGMLERFLCRATTSQLDRIDAVAAALAAKRAELRPQARPRPPARAPAWGAVGPISDPLQHALAFCNAQTRGAAATTCRCWRAAAPIPARSLRLALDPSQKERGRVLARALRAIQSESVCVLREATPTIAERYALCRGDLRVAVAAFDTLARCCYDRPEAGAAAARWLSSAHDYRPLPNIVSSAGMEAAANYFLIRRIGCYVIDIFESRPLSALEQFDELRRALEISETSLTKPSVANILRGVMSQIGPYCDSATAATWMPRASDGPSAARDFAWRVLRLMPLSEQLLALPAIAADVSVNEDPVEILGVTRNEDAVEILAAVGADACRPFLAQVAPALAEQIRSGPPAQSKRIVQVLGSLGAWSDGGALPLTSLLDHACEYRPGRHAVRIAASRVLSCALREAPVPVVEALLPCLLELGRFPEQRSTLILLACERLAPERVAAHLRSAVGVDNLLETNGVITLIKDLIECGVNLCGVDHERTRRSMPDMQELFFDALKTVAAALAAGPLRGVPRLLNDPPPSASKVCTLCDLLLPFLSPDDASRAAEQALAFSAQKMGDDLFGDGDGYRYLTCWVQGSSHCSYYLGDLVALRVASRHAVARACLEDASARGPSLTVSRALLQYARAGLGTAEFATGLTPWLTNALPLRRVPLTVLTTCDATPREFFDSWGDHEAAAAALRTLDAIAEALTAAAPDELPSAVVDGVTRLASEVYDNMWPPRETKHVENSLRYLFALKPRLRLACRDALRIICSNHKDAKARERVQRDLMRAARSNRRRRQFRLEIIGAYGRCCDAAGTADLVRLLDDEDDEVRGAAAIALVEYVILNDVADLDMTTRRRVLRELGGWRLEAVGGCCAEAGPEASENEFVETGGRRLESLAAFSSELSWCAEACAEAADSTFVLGVALLFVADHDERVSAEGEAIFKRSLDYLSPPIVNAILELTGSLREEVRERACRLITRFLDAPSCLYFSGKPDARDAVFRRIEPLLRDESAAVRCAAALTACACAKFHYILETGTRDDVAVAAVSALADFVLHESHEASRESIAHQLRDFFADGIASALSVLYPRQPMLDAFVVKRRRKRRRRSEPAVERPPCVSP